jgi:hypothetical protein
MTTSSDEAAQLEQGVRRLAINRGFGVDSFSPLEAVPTDGEPVVFVAPSGRHYALETRVLDVTGWEDER